MTDPERNAEPPQDGDHLMSESDGEEGHVEEADQVRDTEESGEEAEPVLRRSTRNRRPPDRYGNPLSLPDVGLTTSRYMSVWAHSLKRGSCVTVIGN